MSIVKVWDNVYEDEELSEIWRVLETIHEGGLWDSESKVGSAKLKKENRRTGRGVWLGSVGKRELPEDLHGINLIVMKLYDKGFTGDYASEGLFERGILLTNSHENLLSYYEDGDRYLPHWDASPYTALTWFCKEPQAFSGGDLYFPELDQTLPFANNRTVIFPGHIWHEVTPVSMSKDKCGLGLGRYCLTQFLRIDSHKHAEETK
jgi:hypothetical protein